MNYQAILENVYQHCVKSENLGDVASYIPELALIDPNKFGIHLSSIDGQRIGIGDYEEKFSIQSIAKVLSLAMVYDQIGDELSHRVGVEPSGNAFNSLLQLEYENGVPRNPLINAGAMVVCDILISQCENAKQQFLDFLRKISNNPKINYSDRIAKSEKSTGFRNAGLINLMKSFGNIHNDIEEVLDLYFNLCSIEMSCQELSKCFLFLANHGQNDIQQERVINPIHAKRINAIMLTCGFYDEAGEFSFKVGLPGKSGVGGGIIAIHPGEFSVAVWSPRLNMKGNSYRGMKFLEQFTNQTNMSIF